MTPSGEKYEEKKRRLSEEFQRNVENKNSISLHKNTSNLFRDRNPSKKLDVRDFNRVLSIDLEKRIATVEAMITYEDLVKETLRCNLLPAVVPELKTITIGGALVGLGIESSSFRYGLVHETILEVEVLTGEGKIVACRRDNAHRDLFYALPNSYGTFGYCLKITLQLIPAKKFIKITHLRYHNVSTYFDKLKELCLKKRSADTDSYIDGVIFKENELYINLAEFTDEAPKVNRYTYMNIYYQSIQTHETQYLTTSDYIWRWDTDWFWCSKHFGMQHKILRFLLGKFLLGSAVYWKLSSNSLIKTLAKFFSRPSESVIQDILIPIQNAPKFFDFFKKNIPISPIWICPFHFYHPGQTYPLLPLDPDPLYIDFGFWDIVPSDKPKSFLNRLLEEETPRLKGYKSLYSQSFYPEDEFWRIHPKPIYDEIKQKYDPRSSLKNLYQKCVTR